MVIALCALAATLTAVVCNTHFSAGYGSENTPHQIHRNVQLILNQCAALNALPGPPVNFLAREVSDRFEPGTKPTLIRNATIWTGAHNGTEVIFGDILLDGGIIKGIGEIPDFRLASVTDDLVTIDANGAWLTPGIVDLHSHLGLLSAPVLGGAFDVTSPNGPVLPYLRSIDGFNTHDDAFQLAISGGVTSVQVLPGSGNAIGGQAFMMKLRKTSERSPSSMILEPPHSLNGSVNDLSAPPRWRHMIQSCGENLRRYGARMDSAWSFRAAYHKARQIKVAQDSFCQKAGAGLWESIDGDFPEDLKWEMLVDVLRGKVKISNHCHEAVDLDQIVRLSNEFKFPIASFHHASEAWLVPDLLKRVWGSPPVIALFATNHRYKRESFRGSEFAARVLADNNISVVMQSYHPTLNSRYVLYEAQQAHHFGLPPHLSLASVTAVPASAAGLEHRIGILAKGTDADVVLWDSHPLHIGATPVKVWIDGILQIPVPLKTGEKGGNVIVGKGKDGQEWREVPPVPNWDKERKTAIEWDGLPPLEGEKESSTVVFKNVREVWTRGSHGVVESFYKGNDELGVVLVEGGKIICAGTAATCVPIATPSGAVVDLHGGSISPGLMSFGSPLGLEEIAGEPSTGNGVSYNALVEDIPRVFGDVSGIMRAVDALQFGTRNALTAHRSGVTLATVSLTRRGGIFGGETSFVAGLSATFRTGAAHAMQRGAVVQNVAALHVTLGKPQPLSRMNSQIGASVSEQVATLRRLLFGFEPIETETGRWFKKAIEGVVPLVIEVGSADIMATLLNLKAEAEERWGTRMRMVFAGATEAHLLAKEIGKAGVGVILNPIRPYPLTWDHRRILAGPPLTNNTNLVSLMENQVTVAVGVPDAWEARNARFDIAWAKLESNGRIDEQQAYSLASTNLEKLLGIVNLSNETADLVAYEGGSAFDLSSKVVAVLSAERGVVDLM
ncbi:hypothetical protein PILCRDRAFT_69640 [Piloderma croceum F 1598]|uniref:Amidohydrolase-related domain-containing protein n=1 Tax=Piloderma croceum (strain F 1598) TaxID=765440 RepID=A0A0C3BAR6_PILCF|nr:hypothetical protein PILCRDRAFT_69640 [Piloderma croceum F 1598]